MNRRSVAKSIKREVFLSGIKVNGVNHYFGEKTSRKQILFDINLEIDPGEIVIMSGPSGSGKTTLLTLIGAIRTVQEGTVNVFGQELSGLTRSDLVEVRRNIGFIFQHHNLFESLSAVQNVKMALALTDIGNREMNQRANEILIELGLKERLKAKPKAMSGGQKQRVAVARALANNPALILADEPTAALDKDSGRNVVNLLKRQTEEYGTTVIIVTHDNRILDVANRIITMVDGRIASNVVVEETVAICEFLSKCPTFSELTPSALTDVAGRMRTESFPANSTIIREGEEGNRFYLIKTGRVDVLRQVDGQIMKLDSIGPGNFFGEAALITGKPRNATIVATEGVELYTLNKDDFQMALEKGESFRSQLLGLFFRRQQ
jgi:putative ABC transport system ATP-binding protein